MAQPLRRGLAAALVVPCVCALRAAILDPPSADRAALPSAGPASAGPVNWPVHTNATLKELDEPVEEKLMLDGENSSFDPAPQSGIDLLNLAVRVMNGYHSREVHKKWAAWQEGTASRLLQSLSPQKQLPIRVLVVTYVKDTGRYIDIWEDNVKTLLANNFGDTFNFVFNHFDKQNDMFKGLAWYNNQSVVGRVLLGGCKANFWFHLDANLVKQYNYVWLIDGDLSLSFFNWALYRAVLTRLRPAVSQPAIIPKKPGGRASDIAGLSAKPSFYFGDFEVAWEATRSESMSPIIDADIWPSLSRRLEGADLRTVWYLNTWWDLASHLMRRHCGGPGIVVVNSSPVLHVDARTMDSATARRSECIRRVTEDDLNNRRIGRPEREALKLAVCKDAARALDEDQDATRSRSRLHPVTLKKVPSFLSHWTLDALQKP